MIVICILFAIALYAFYLWGKEKVGCGCLGIIVAGLLFCAMCLVIIF
jgi:hypothetical protein